MPQECDLPNNPRKKLKTSERSKDDSEIKDDLITQNILQGEKVESNIEKPDLIYDTNKDGISKENATEDNNETRQTQNLDDIGRDNNSEDNGSKNEDEYTGNLHLIDEVAEDDVSEDSEDSFYDSEVPEEEIDALLEEGLPDEMKGGPKKDRNKKTAFNNLNKDASFEMVEKYILIEKKKDHFEVLPEGWLEVIHCSGMPIYLHKETRVCTFSRPYFLGSGSVRKHIVPLTAIPCLKYLKDREKVEVERKEREAKESNNKEAESNDDIKKDVDSNDLNSLPPGPLADAILAQSALTQPTVGTSETNPALAAVETRIESLKEAKEQRSLDAKTLRDYCKKRFEFKTINTLRFKSWHEHKRYEREERRKRPHLPEGTKLISLVKHYQDEGGMKKEWLLNPKGKSYVCILHEYIQHVLRTQPNYIYKEVENPARPYAATISINDINYGTGYGSSKKLAKHEAARLTLEILIPELGKEIRRKKTEEDDDLSFFDEIKVEDSRVPDLCNKTGELSPYTILGNCIQRNFGLSKANIECGLITNQPKKNEFYMVVGKHRVQVPCRNKKDGKLKASQAILQKLHPQINSWGSLLRLYGNRSVRVMQERKSKEQEVTLLQTNASLHQPNQSILDKLKEEMLKLGQMKGQIVPIRPFTPPEGVCLPTSHGTDLNNVDL